MSDDPRAGRIVLRFVVTDADVDLPQAGEEFSHPVRGGADYFELGTVIAVHYSPEDGSRTVELLLDARLGPVDVGSA